MLAASYIDKHKLMRRWVFGPDDHSELMSLVDLLNVSTALATLVSR